MKPDIVLTHQFVESVPDEIGNGILYVSMHFATAIHKCCCGCGREVVTPLAPKRWHLTFDGKTISLYPSIGNWSMPCQSHYWIKHNRVVWAPRGLPSQVSAIMPGTVPAQDRRSVTDAERGPAEAAVSRRGWRGWLKRIFGGRDK